MGPALPWRLMAGVSPWSRRARAREIRGLWIRDLATSEWQLVSGAGDEIPSYPFWSPDGRSLAYFVDGKLVRTDPPNFAPIPICDVPDGRGGAWLPDGTIVFAPTAQSGLMRVSASGGTPEVLADRREGELGLKFPAVAGDGRLLFWAQHRDPAHSEIRVMRVADPLHATPVVRSEGSGTYDGATLFYRRSGALIGQPFDAETGRLEDAVVSVAVNQLSTANVGAFSVSAARGHLAVANTTPGQTQSRWLDWGGKPLAALGEPTTNGKLDISPNARRVAVVRSIPGEPGTSVWICRRPDGRGAEGRGRSWRGIRSGPPTAGIWRFARSGVLGGTATSIRSTSTGLRR